MKTALNIFGQIQNKTKKQLANLAELNRLFLGKNGIFVKIQNTCLKREYLAQATWEKSTSSY